MPRVPQSPSRIPGSGGGVARPVPTNPFAGQGLRQAGAALSRTAFILTQVAAQQQAFEDNVDRVRREGEFVTSMAEGMAQLDPVAPNYLQDVSDLFEESRAAVEGTFKTAGAQARYDMILEQHRTNYTQAALKNRSAAYKDRALVAAEESLRQTLSNITSDPEFAGTYAEAFKQDMATIMPTNEDGSSVFTENERTALAERVQELSLIHISEPTRPY